MPSTSAGHTLIPVAKFAAFRKNHSGALQKSLANV
jgi:hypothetical protein